MAFSWLLDYVWCECPTQVRSCAVRLIVAGSGVRRMLSKMIGWVIWRGITERLLAGKRIVIGVNDLADAENRTKI
jgi:hypothetical protein